MWNAWIPRTIGRLFYYFFHRANTRLPERNVTLPEEMTEGLLENNTGYMTIEQLDKTHYLAFLPVGISLPTSMFEVQSDLYKTLAG